MMTWYVNHVTEHATHRCRHCGRPLAWVDEVGWVNTTPGDSYDICEADVYGNHLADPMNPPAGRHH